MARKDQHGIDPRAPLHREHRSTRMPVLLLAQSCSSVPSEPPQSPSATRPGKGVAPAGEEKPITWASALSCATSITVGIISHASFAPSKRARPGHRFAPVPPQLRGSPCWPRLSPPSFPPPGGELHLAIEAWCPGRSSLLHPDRYYMSERKFPPEQAKGLTPSSCKTPFRQGNLLTSGEDSFTGPGVDYLGKHGFFPLPLFPFACCLKNPSKAV